MWLLPGIRQLKLWMFIVFLVGCQPTVPRHVFEGQTMGTYYRVTLAEPPCDEGLQQAIDKQLERLNRLFSHYLIDSELSRFNQFRQQRGFAASPALLDLINTSLQISRLSDGYFDITLAPLINAYGFGSQVVEDLPDEEFLQDMRAWVGYQKLRVENGYLYKTQPELTIDLSAIAKGYAIDSLGNWLEQAGCENYLIEIGGELRGYGDKQNWRIAIEAPTLGNSVAHVIGLQNKAIATSGDYRNVRIINGRPYSHIIDPLSFMPKSTILASVSVVHQNATLADAWATALYAMGIDKARQSAEANKLSVLFILRSDTPGQFKIQTTGQIDAWLQ